MGPSLCRRLRAMVLEKALSKIGAAAGTVDLALILQGSGRLFEEPAVRTDLAG